MRKMVDGRVFSIDKGAGGEGALRSCCILDESGVGDFVLDKVRCEHRSVRYQVLKYFTVPAFRFFLTVVLGLQTYRYTIILPDIILLTQCYLHRGTCLNAMKRFCICSL